jgi:hypothetical protein
VEGEGEEVITEPDENDPNLSEPLRSSGPRSQLDLNSVQLNRHQPGRSRTQTNKQRGKERKDRKQRKKKKIQGLYCPRTGMPSYRQVSRLAARQGQEGQERREEREEVPITSDHSIHIHKTSSINTLLYGADTNKKEDSNPCWHHQQW